MFFGVLAGNDEWSDIADFAVDERETLGQYLELSHRIPSHDTIQRVFSILRPDELQGMLVNILTRMVTGAGETLDQFLYQNEELGYYLKDVVAADGKEIHNTGRKNSTDPIERHNLNEFNVMSTEWGICLSSTRIDEKKNEIPEMQKVIRQIDGKGCVVTADAMNTQKETAKAIIEGAHGDYCLALKENQKTAYLEVKKYFSCEELTKEMKTKEGQYRKESEENTDTIITREYFITNDIHWFEDKKKWKKTNLDWI